MKSSSSDGPRNPALSEFWLSPTGTPWLVVSARSVESTRTRSSGTLVLLLPTVGLPLPSLSEPCDSVTVLEPASGSSGLRWAPDSGATAVSGSYSPALLALNRSAAAARSAARSFSPASAAMRLWSASLGSRGWGLEAGRFGVLAIRSLLLLHHQQHDTRDQQDAASNRRNGKTLALFRLHLDWAGIHDGVAVGPRDAADQQPGQPEHQQHNSNCFHEHYGKHVLCPPRWLTSSKGEEV